MVCVESYNYLIFKDSYLRKQFFEFLLLSIGYMTIGNCCSLFYFYTKRMKFFITHYNFSDYASQIQAPWSLHKELFHDRKERGRINFTK